MANNLSLHCQNCTLLLHQPSLHHICFMLFTMSCIPSSRIFSFPLKCVNNIDLIWMFLIIPQSPFLFDFFSVLTIVFTLICFTFLQMGEITLSFVPCFIFSHQEKSTPYPSRARRTQLKNTEYNTLNIYITGKTIENCLSSRQTALSMCHS